MNSGTLRLASRLVGLVGLALLASCQHAKAPRSPAAAVPAAILPPEAHAPAVALRMADLAPAPEPYVSLTASDGTGLALKVTDGNARALRPALAALGGDLGHPLPAFVEVTIPDAHGADAATVALL